jgi:hypothetical protein
MGAVPSRCVLSCAIALGLVSALAACSSPPGTVFRTFDLEGGNSVSTDSRQRIVTNTQPRPTSRPGLVHPRQIICAEPSPDVAIAVANSFGAGLSVLGYGSGSVSASQAEGIAQLAERTVTVQLLRDQMYRACESYANGAISATTYTLLMSKNNDAMVTLMLGETAGGAFGRSLAAIGGGADAEATATLQGLATATDGFKQGIADMAEANEQVAKAQGTVDDKTEQLEALPADADSSVRAAKQQEVDEAKDELATAKAKRDAIAESLQAKSEAVAESAAEVKNLTAAGGIEVTPSAEVAVVLAGMQKELLSEDFVDEYVSACVVELGLVQDLKEREGLRADDSVDAYQVSQLAERGLKGYENEDLNPEQLSQPDLRSIQEERLATASAISAQLRFSGLARHCDDYLFGFMNAAAERKFHIDYRRLHNEQVEAQGTIVKEYNAAQRQCGSLKTSEQQAQCRNSLAKLIDPTAQPAPVPGNALVEGGLILPEVAYAAAEDAKLDLSKAEALLAENLIPAAKEGDDDDRKDDLKQLNEDRKQVQDRLAKVKQTVATELTAAKKRTVEELTEQWSVLEVQRRRAEMKGDTLELKTVNAKLALQQAEAAVSQRNYQQLADEIEGLISAIENHVGEVVAFKAAGTS